MVDFLELSSGKAESQATFRHPLVGRDILAGIPFFESVGEMIVYHRERWDGNGYPCGLAGTAIPLWGRVLFLADRLDVNFPPAPPGLELSYRMTLWLRDGKGTLFDPNLADLAMELVARPQFLSNLYSPGVGNIVNSMVSLKAALDRLDHLEIKMIAPQHGSIIAEQITEHIEALKTLECGDYLLTAGKKERS